MRHKTLRVPSELAEEITRRARIKGVPDADYYRLLIERGLLLERVELALESPVPPGYWTCARLSLRPEISSAPLLPHDHSTIPKAQSQAKDELERMKNDHAK